MTCDNEARRTGQDTAPELVNLIEALLFVAQEPASVDELARCLEVDAIQVTLALQRLERALTGQGLRLQRHGLRVSLTTMPDAAPYVEGFLGLQRTGRLSTAAYETLALIAYRQPIPRAAIEAVRGVNSDGVLRTLLSRGLIEEVGRLEQLGRPILYGTTFQFLQQLGLGSVEELPPLERDDGDSSRAAGG